MSEPRDPEQGQGNAREFRRFPARIQAQVEVIHAWEGSSAGPFLGELYNVSRSGAGLRLDRVFPPRTRLKIALPSLLPGRRLTGEVVWTSAAAGSGGNGPAVYGVHWLEQLSRSALESIVPAEVDENQEPGPTLPPA